LKWQEFKVSRKAAKTIMLTTKCSSGCMHCPFSNPDLEKLFLAPTVIQKIMSQSLETLIVLSGGEPFEHPEISQILINLSKQTTPFRIATGGFVDLGPWISKLKLLSRPSGVLQGISVGTDVLSSRVNHSNWIPVWKNNIRFFFEFQIPYSLTFSVGTDLDFTRLNLWKWADLFDGKPEFIYLRYSNKNALQEWVQKIQDTFESVPIIQDELTENMLHSFRVGLSSH